LWWAAARALFWHMGLLTSCGARIFF
jgi:hypothetical protein